MIFSLILSIAIPLLVGALGSIFTSSSVKTWYPTLNKPVLNPPNWIFGPVWTVLYILIGINLHNLWNKFKQNKLEPQLWYLYLFQLVLNAIWSPVFFGMRSPAIGLVIILSLLAILVYLEIKFFKQHSLNFWLMLPYLLWVSFATYLNLSIVMLN